MYGKKRFTAVFAIFTALVIAPLALFSQVPSDTVLFSNTNIYAVQNSPSVATSFTLEKPHVVTYIMTYHYFNNGTLPGSITLIHSDGSISGPWQASGKPGQGGVPNANWEVRPNAEIKAGTWLIVDSDFRTWSKNAESANRGHALVKGYPANTPTVSVPPSAGQQAPGQYSPGQPAPGPAGFVDLSGEWDIVGNGSPGTMTIGSQQGSVFSGKVYTERLAEGVLSGGRVSFVRLWADGFRQDFSGTLSVNAGGFLCAAGTFSQQGSGSYQWTAVKKTKSGFPAVASAPVVPDLSGDWELNANGSMGSIRIAGQRGASFGGTVFTEKLTEGLISDGKVSFIRKWETGFQQEYWGTLTVDAQGNMVMAGNFSQNGSGSSAWTAVRRRK